jgi:AraC-like DNA-binding protein/mannose-6-phosphate isomerase-like protein (cupin superfamily)
VIGREPRSGRVRLVWTDIERFGIEDLIEADPRGQPAGRPRSFAVQVPELRSVDVHWHDYYELGYVLGGEAVHAVNGVRVRVSPGSAFLLSPADFHSFEPLGDRSLRMLNAVVHPELVERTLESVHPDGELGLPWSLSSLPGMEHDVHRVTEEVSERGRGWDTVVESAIRSMIVELARSSVGTPTAVADGGDPGPPAHVRRALRHVERHFREPLTLAQVAAVAHLSPHWFSEQFRRATGNSFQSYLKRRRLQFARALLESTELGVTEVGHAAGFSDPSYFARAYRSHYGRSPSESRQPAG